MAFNEDFDAYFNEFAVRCSVNTSSFDAIFDNEYYAVDDGDAGIMSAQPRLVCKSSDVSALVPYDVVTVSAQSYKIIEIMPDGTGITILRLMQQ